MLPRVRVRFSPSPTGFLHIGGLRTALYNYLFAKKHNGTFILRIEDTDQSRTVPGGLENIVQTLTWCGLLPEEGLFLENSQLRQRGGLGPYVQSKRLSLYQTYAHKLVEQGSAYFCTCSSQRLEKLRQEQTVKKESPRYDGLCRKQQHSSGVIRLKVPRADKTVFEDLVRGHLEFENALLDDQVLIKSDGFPTYHLANVVDDHLMEITHVIRGEEWLPSTPKHVLLYQAFGWALPQFAHLPLLLNADHSKLSKRQGDVAVEDYIKKGYLPETLINFVALLGWNPRGDQELYTLDELITSFELRKINKSGGVVNFEKLDWMNGHYLRKKTAEELAQLCLPYWIAAGLLEKSLQGELRMTHSGEPVEFAWLTRIISLEQERLKTLSEIVPATEFFLVAQPQYDPALLIGKKMEAIQVLNSLEALTDYLKQYREVWTAQVLESTIKSWIKQQGRGVGEVLWPMRVALSGRPYSPPPFELAEILGPEKTQTRLVYACKQAKDL